MKFIVLTLTAVHIVLAQPTLQKTWVGKNNDYLRVRKDTIDVCTGFWLLHMPYSLAADTIKVPMEFWKILGDSRYGKPHLYHVKYLTDHSLVLADEFGSDTSPGRPYEIRYVDSTVTYDRDFTFDSLYFAATGCFGRCPSMQLAISSNGSVRFEGRMYTEPFTGCYTGTLPRDWIDHLHEVLKSSRVDSIPDDLGITIDAPRFKFRIAHNRWAKSVSGCNFPSYNLPLLTLLYDAYKAAELTKVDTVLFAISPP